MQKTVALRALFLFSAAGLLAELLLSKHWDGVWQVAPLVLLAGGFVEIAGPMNPTRVRGVMALFILSGLAGAVLHYWGKVEFALERNPSLAGWEFVRETLKGTSPPILAPGAMIALGLLGLILAAKPDRSTS